MPTIKKYIRDPFPSLSHAAGAVFSGVALNYLLVSAGDNLCAQISGAIFGTTLILLYLASALAHGVTGSPRLERFLEDCDHAAIFLLIAGTYTPVCLLMIPGNLGLALLTCEWIFAAVGIYTVFFLPQASKAFRAGTYLGMGWMFLFAINPLVTTLPISILVWLAGGVLFYSVGSVVFVTGRPSLWAGKFEAHDLWHVFVLSGSSCHFMFVNEHILTLAQ